jgi:hypothetical protein
MLRKRQTLWPFGAEEMWNPRYALEICYAGYGLVDVHFVHQAGKVDCHRSLVVHPLGYSAKCACLFERASGAVCDRHPALGQCAEGDGRGG